MAVGKLLIRKNDRIVFFGDSITQAQMYTNYAETYLALRYPKLNLQFFNAGWGGDTSLTGMSRLERDVIALRPTLVTICFGMNDGRYTAPTKEILGNFTRGLREIVARLKELKIRILLLTPGAVDEDNSSVVKAARYNELGLRQMADIVLRFARKEKIPAYDMQKLMLGVQTAAKAADPTFTMSPDSVHPDAAGHLVMAFGLLEALGVPSRNSVAAVSAKTRRVRKADGLDSTNVSVAGNRLRLELRCSQAPYRLPDGSAKVLPFLPFQERFNTCAIAIRDLPTGKYILRLGPNRSLIADAAELAAGINLLGLGEVSMLDWAGQIAGMINSKNVIYFEVWRAQALGHTHGETYDRAIHRQGIALNSKLDATINSRIRRRVAQHITAEIFPAPAIGQYIDNGDFLTRWAITDPIHAPFDTDSLGGESAASLANAQTNGDWTERTFAPDGLGGCLSALFAGKEHCFCYARIRLESPIAQSATLLLGSDDGFAAWLNGSHLGANLAVERGVAPDGDRMPVSLAAGANILLVKITQLVGGWGFCVRFAGLDQPIVAMAP